jgi:hypothetical protein
MKQHKLNVTKEEFFKVKNFLMENRKNDSSDYQKIMDLINNYLNTDIIKAGELSPDDKINNFATELGKKGDVASLRLLSYELKTIHDELVSKKRPSDEIWWMLRHVQNILWDITPPLYGKEYWKVIKDSLR